MAAAADPPAQPEAATPVQTTGIADQAQRFRDATEQIRQRTELTAKALGGLGITAVSAVGIAKFADVFPWAPGQRLWVGLLILSFLIMIFMVGVFTYRLWHVSERILLRSDVEQMGELDSAEKDTVRQLYRETARLDRAPSLRALEARAHRLYRIADRTADPKLVAKLIQRADDIVADIRSVEARAGMVVVRRRAGQAIRGRGAKLAFVFLALAIVGFGISADRLDSERTQLTKTVKDCADAKTAAQIGGLRALPRICLPPKGSTGATGPAQNGGGNNKPSLPKAPAKGTTERVRAASAAIRAAAGIAVALAPLGVSTTTAAGEGPKILEDFLREVGFPLTKTGLSRLAGALWNRFAVPHPPRLPIEVGHPQQSQPIKLTVVLRDRRSPIQVVQLPNTPPLFIFRPRQRYQTIKLTVVVRERRPRIQIIRVPVDSDG
jgi:hypothetical protein